uniref:Ovule protein n=1 Tax=Elaeophora elaphi TaxID=1147741 RepID=A0A0R3S747_9BILA
MWKIVQTESKQRGMSPLLHSPRFSRKHNNHLKRSNTENIWCMRKFSVSSHWKDCSFRWSSMIPFLKVTPNA